MPIQKENMIIDPQRNMRMDYGQAIIHLAWDWDGSAGEGSLVFGMVELFPKESMPPSETEAIHKELDRRGDHSVSLQRFQVPADEAIKWYEACRRGEALELNPKGKNPRGFKLAPLSEEPVWPNLTTLIDSDFQTVPFLADWHRCPRLHHLIPIQDEFINSLWMWIMCCGTSDRMSADVTRP